MNQMEALELCDFITDVLPNQKMNPGTPEAWAIVLADIPFGLAKIAVVHIARTSAFLSPSEIIHVVRRMRTTARRAVRREARDRGILVNVDLEADAAICAGLVDFAGIDLMRPEPDHVYQPQVARLSAWNPPKEIGA